jgi:hypothetical protein
MAGGFADLIEKFSFSGLQEKMKLNKNSMENEFFILKGFSNCRI